MAYDEDLADRIRATLPSDARVDERKMFGGLAFMLDGHMVCGVTGDSLMLRLGPDRAQRALNEDNVRPMEFTGRPMKGMVFVGPDGLDDDALVRWVGDAIAFVRELPPRR